MDSDNCDSPRRVMRKRIKPKKYGDFLELSPKKRGARMVTDSSEDDEDFKEQQMKPTALFTEDDVEGQDMFKFKSRHTKLDLQNKVNAVISNSPSAKHSPIRTPRKSLLKGATSNETPRHVKDVLKKRIIKEVESDSAESDFSGSSSDFVPEDSEKESEPSSASGSEEEEEKEEVKKPAAKTQIVRTKDMRNKKDSDYIVAPDNYFMMHSSKKIATSDHTLARLKNMNLNDTPHESYITEEHMTKINELNQSYEQLFNKWLYVLSENFNIITYGIGSKRNILQQFQKEKLQEFPCVVINGFFPSLTMKSVLESIIIDLLGNSSVPNNIGDVVTLIDAQLVENDIELFIIVHNIDGVMLRSAKAQAMLASLSAIKNVHLIASIDHINAPLLWDHTKLSKFNFTWWDVTTFMPYTVETSFENSLLTQRSGALQLSSLRSVFQSLTTNAKGIFKVIIQYQLDNYKQGHYQGLPFKDLYSKSREQFLVSSDLALRAQLTEFLDHKLVKMKRSIDGSENLIIPIDNVLLQQFIEEQES